MTIEERARKQEKSRFSKEELDKLNKVHGVNSAFGIGYYIGATEQEQITKREFMEKACKWIDERCAGGVHPSLAWNLSNEFRKAMEKYV